MLARESAPRADGRLPSSPKYKQVCASLSGLKPDLDEEALSSIGSTIQVYPYEYGYEAKGPSVAANRDDLTDPLGGDLRSGRLAFADAHATAQRERPAIPRGTSIRDQRPGLQVTLGRSPGACTSFRTCATRFVRNRFLVSRITAADLWSATAVVPPCR